MNFHIIDIKVLICTFVISQKLFLFLSNPDEKDINIVPPLSDSKFRLLSVWKILAINRVNDIMGMLDICITSKK